MKKPHPKKPIFEYNKINNYIYIGTNQCCMTHFNSKLIRRGIKADISLEDTKLDQPFGVKYYLWLPTRDHEPPTMQSLLLGADFIKRLISKKIPVYVHCENGHKRSPTLVAAYLILKGMSVKEAVDLIQKKRPSTHLEKKHIDRLKKFEKEVKK